MAEVHSKVPYIHLMERGRQLSLGGDIRHPQGIWDGGQGNQTPFATRLAMLGSDSDPNHFRVFQGSL